MEKINYNGVEITPIFKEMWVWDDNKSEKEKDFINTSISEFESPYRGVYKGWKHAEEIKEPEYVPYSYNDANELLGMKVKSKVRNDYTVITTVYEEKVIFGNNAISSFFELLNLYVKYPDGTPCGKLKEDE
jgi:hypothetical protein